MAQATDSDPRLVQFGLRLARLLAPQLPPATVQAAIQHVLTGADASPASPRKGALAGRKLELVFVHDCRNHGCNTPHCVLCKHNPNKRCSGNFAHKYWVGDRLLAKCEGEIQVELIDTETHQRVLEDLSAYRVEACVLEGHKYNTKCREAGEQRLDILDRCEVLVNQRNEALLVSSSAAANGGRAPRVTLKFPPGASSLPMREMKVTESSESVLAGTKRPPFRLVVRLVAEDGTRLPVRPAVSEEFVVVTKRTKNLKKQEIPSLDDPIAKLNHVGKETVKKLNELKASADEVAIDLGLPPDLDKIRKVKDFLRLARLSEADGHRQQKLKQLLKLSKEKWDAACEHAKLAVQADNRMRAWYEPDMAVGLLFACALGGVRPDCPVALIQNRRHEGVDFMEVIPMEHQLPSQREQVQETCEQAIQCWWRDSHPGWMIFTLGNRHFESLEQIISFSRAERQAGEAAPEAGQEEQPAEAAAEPGPARGSTSPGGPDASRTSDAQAVGSGAGDGEPSAAPPPQAPPERASAVSSPRGQPFASAANQAAHSGAGAAPPEAQGLLPAGSGDGYNPFEILSSMPFSALGSQALAAAAVNGEDGKAGRRPPDGALNSAAAALAAGSLPSMLPQLFSLGTLAKLGSVPSLGMLGDLGLLSMPPEDAAAGGPPRGQAQEEAAAGRPGKRPLGSLGAELGDEGPPHVRRRAALEGGGRPQAAVSRAS